MLDTDKFDAIRLETAGLLLAASEDSLAVPEPDETWNYRLKELREANLPSHLAQVIHEMRVWQAEQLGFYSSYPSFSEILMGEGERYTDTVEKEERADYDYMYFHNEDRVTIGDKCNWGYTNPNTYVKKQPKGKWYLPPFGEPDTIWSIEQILCLDDLKNPLPLDVIAGINGLKRLKLFNNFKAYQSEASEKTLITASLMKIWDNKGTNSHTFFIACY